MRMFTCEKAVAQRMLRLVLPCVRHATLACLPTHTTLTVDSRQGQLQLSQCESPEDAVARILAVGVDPAEETVDVGAVVEYKHVAHSEAGH